MHPSGVLTHSTNNPEIPRESLQSFIEKILEKPQESLQSFIEKNSEKAQEFLLSSFMKKNLETFCSTSTFFRELERISNEDRNVFVPVNVSIGPFHRGAPHLEAMQHIKWCYFRAFLKNSPPGTLKRLVEVVVDPDSQLKACYAKQFNDCGSLEFSQMMLLDCCFILELLLRFSKKSRRRRNDPVFTTPGLLFELRCDLILLENQIPYFLLNDVYEKVQDLAEENMSLNNLTFRFFRTMVAGDRNCVYESFMMDADHLLAMVYSCFLPTCRRMEMNEESKSRELPGASNLKTNGIKFMNARSPKSLLDIKFQNGVLEIPPLQVYPQTETILRNLIAYETRQHGSLLPVKSYVNFMSHLLQSDQDVKILCGSKILSDREDDEEQIIRNLKWMSGREDLSGTYFDGIVQKVNEKPDTPVARWSELRESIGHWRRRLLLCSYSTSAP